MKLLREPLLHFLLLGVAMFVVFSLFDPAPDGQGQRIVITPGQVEHLAAGFSRTWKRPPTEAELQGLIEAYIQEEIYYREALALGLDRDDAIVRRRLMMKLQFLTDGLADAITPSDEQLAAFLQAHPEDYRLEPRLSFRQVYLNGDRRGPAAEVEARRLLQVLNQGLPAAEAATLGDRLLLPGEMEAVPHSQVLRLFGKDFADRLLKLPEGRWSGPVASGYGLHLIHLARLEPGRPAELDEVRQAVTRDWLARQRQELARATYQRLRDNYSVEVQHPAGAITGLSLTEAGP